MSIADFQGKVVYAKKSANYYTGQFTDFSVFYGVFNPDMIGVSSHLKSGSFDRPFDRLTVLS